MDKKSETLFKQKSAPPVEETAMKTTTGTATLPAAAGATWPSAFQRPVRLLAYAMELTGAGVRLSLVEQAR